jgi:hypothetical protein
VLESRENVTRDPPSGPYYLDAIFASIRTFAQDMETCKRWLGRAEQTENQVWRLSFLREARAAEGRTRRTLEAVQRRVAGLGAPEALPAPLDRMHVNLAAMRTDLAEQAERLGRLETREIEAPPVGRA